MNVSIKIIGVLAMILVSCSACQNEAKQTTTTPADTVALPSDTITTNELELPLPPFPTMADKVENLIPKHHEIDLEANGDLNNDGVADKVIVLLNKRDTIGIRTTLVLLKQKDAYSVNAISYTAISPKYRDNGYKIYDYENIGIDSGKLVTTMQSTGPSGSIKSTYKYIKNDLTLTQIITFNAGAGGQVEQKLDLLKGVYEQTDINTMKEDMPSTTSTKKYKIPKALFKDSDPSEIMTKAFDKVGN